MSRIRITLNGWMEDEWRMPSPRMREKLDVQYGNPGLLQLSIMLTQPFITQQINKNNARDIF